MFETEDSSRVAINVLERMGVKEGDLEALERVVTTDLDFYEHDCVFWQEESGDMALMISPDSFSLVTRGMIGGQNDIEERVVAVGLVCKNVADGQDKSLGSEYEYEFITVPDSFGVRDYRGLFVER